MQAASIQKQLEVEYINQHVQLEGGSGQIGCGEGAVLEKGFT